MRETKKLEFKEEISNSFLKTVSAFANYGIGKIVFGVRDDGEIVGVKDLKGSCLAIENKINDSIVPTPDFTLAPNSENKTIELKVSTGPHKPYFYKAKAYKRSDTATVEVSKLELNRLVLLGENLTFDATPSHMKKPSFKTLESRAKESFGITTINDDNLKTLELEDAKGQFNVAAELLSDINSFPGIDIARFGNSISIFKERLTLEKQSVITQYEQAIDVYRRNYRNEIVSDEKRVLHELIPEVAFREAVANALVHRQWDTTAHIRVSMFDDKIEVVSPGGLPDDISEKEYLTGQISILRNPILGNVFFRLGIIERFGTGVVRIKDSYATSDAKPSFFVSENSIRIVLPLLETCNNLTIDEKKVFRIIQGKTLPISEISGPAQFGKTKTHNILKKLNAKGYVEVVGTGRGTKYRG